MKYTKKFKCYVLIDPITEVPRYVGITVKEIKLRLAEHLNDVYNRPELNPHKTAWFKNLMSSGFLPKIQQIAEFDNEQEMKQFEIEYIKKYRDLYNLINQTPGGDWPGFRIHSRSSILKKKTTRAVVQYNVLGEKIAEYEMIEDVRREYNLSTKSCTHITQCCKGVRQHAYGYIWRYKGEPLGDISVIDPTSISFNKIVQYKDNVRIAEFDNYMQASISIGDRSKGSNIRSVILGNLTSCKGYIFQLEPIYVYFDRNLYLNRINNSKQIDKTRFKKHAKKVTQLDINGNVINNFNSLSEASLYILSSLHGRDKIKECCEGKREKYRDFIWKYS